jgi:hypothetical protein
LFELDHPSVCTITTSFEPQYPLELQRILDGYKDLFKEPNNLPPARPLDHSIHLLPGAPPINIRSYRYSPAQKDEIEKQLAEMCRMVSSSLATV